MPRSSVHRVGVVAGVLALALALAAPASGSPLSSATSGDQALSELAATGQVIALRDERPSWLTDSLLAEVLDADGRPVAAPVDAPLPGTVGIRPGSWMVAPYGCTMNFVFADGGDLGIGTAGHCVDGKGDEVVLLTLAPGAENPVLVNIGEVVVHRDEDIGDDFALARIRPELHDWVSPTIAVVGGPCGSYYGGGPETVGHYGHGVGIGTGGTPRAGAGLKWEEDAYGFVGVIAPGDSGSPARVTDLSAAGNITHIIVHPQWLPNVAAGTRIGKILQIASGWDLVNSSLCPFGSDDSGSPEDDDGGNGNGPPEDRGGGNGDGGGNGPPEDRGGGSGGGNGNGGGNGDDSRGGGRPSLAGNAWVRMI